MSGGSQRFVMTVLRHSDPDRVCADTAWDRLFAELDSWRANGRTATLWWRDDDATTASPALERLLTLQVDTGVPLALAVIPRRLDGSLAAALAGRTGVSVLQHGYSHDNFAAAGERKIELDGSRPADHVIADLAMGLQTLSALPGWRPVLVPPWNRIAPHLVPMLPEIGFCGLSTLGPRVRRAPVTRLTQNNVHLDPVDWRGRQAPARRFIGEARALETLTAHLADRRDGRADADEASGLMTHHKAQSSDVWQFVARLIQATVAHPAVRWCAAAELFES